MIRSIIKTAGANVSPVEVERAIVTVSSMAAHVLGIPDADLETMQHEVTDVFHLAAAYDLAVTKADGDLKVEKEKCDALPAAQQSACNSTAEAAYETAKAAAETARSAAQASADALKK